MKLFVLLTSAAFFLACGDGSLNRDTRVQKLGDREVLADPSVEISELSLSGTGTVKFVAPIASEAKAAKHVGIEFSKIDASKSASVTLITFADQDLNNGVEFHLSDSTSFIRTAAGAVDLSDRLALNWNERNHLRFDIHNNENPAHLIIWNQDLADTTVAEDHEIFNSGEFKAQMTATGSGTFMAIKIENAKVHNVIIGEVLETEHAGHDHGEDGDHEDHDHDKDHDHDHE